MVSVCGTAACRVTYKADWTFSATAFPTKFTVISTFLDNPDERECCARCVYANNCDLFGVDETAQKCTLYSRVRVVTSACRDHIRSVSDLAEFLFIFVFSFGRLLAKETFCKARRPLWHPRLTPLPASSYGHEVAVSIT